MTDELAAVDVTLSRELLYDMDEYATLHGYANQSAVVSAALAEHSPSKQTADDRREVQSTADSA